MTLPLSYRASASFADVEELCSGPAARSSPRLLISSRLHVSDRRPVLVRDYAAMDSGGMWAGAGQSPRWVRIFPVCSARRRQVDHPGLLDEREDQTHGTRFREGNKSHASPITAPRAPLIRYPSVVRGSLAWRLWVRQPYVPLCRCRGCQSHSRANAYQIFQESDVAAASEGESQTTLIGRPTTREVRQPPQFFPTGTSDSVELGL